MAERENIISIINHPLSFFVLALLIVETSLAVILILSDLNPSQKFYGMWAVVGLFILLISIVSGLVWFKPKYLIYQAEDHLKEEASYKLEPFKQNKKIDTKKNKTGETKKSALVEYKIASVLPGTAHYDLVDDGKVWFWLANLEDKKYKVYIETEFISEGYHKKLNEGYYGGKKEFNLNAFTTIQAPGLNIPSEIKEFARQGKKVEIRINCTIKDENDKLVEKKLPVGFVYSKKNKNWYFEP